MNDGLDNAGNDEGIVDGEFNSPVGVNTGQGSMPGSDKSGDATGMFCASLQFCNSLCSYEGS